MLKLTLQRNSINFHGLLNANNGWSLSNFSNLLIGER